MKQFVRLQLCLITISFLFSIQLFAINNDKIKSLKIKLETSKQDTDKIKILGDLSWELQTTDIEAAEKYSTEELALAKKCHTEKLLGLAYNDLGTVKLRKGSLKDALALNQSAYNIRKKLNDELGMASSLNKIGTIHQQKDEFAEALKCFLGCLTIYEKNQIKPYIAYSVNNVGNVYFQMHQSEKALPFFEEALAINRAMGDFPTVAGNLINIGNIHIEFKKYDSAKIELKEAISLLNKIGNKSYLPMAYNGLAMAYKYQGKFAEAMPFYLQALQFAEAIKDTTRIISYTNNVANNYLQLKQPDLAKPLIDKAFELATLTNQKNQYKQCYTQYFHYFAQKNDYEKADEYFNLYEAFRDSVASQNLNNQIAEMETKYETEKKVEENLLLKKDNKIKTLTVIFLLVGLILAALIFILIFSRNKMKQQEILQNQKLEMQEQRSKAVLEAEEHERQRIAKDLHDGLGQMLSSVKLNLSTIQKNETTLNNNQQILLQNSISIVDDSVKEVRTISHNMMPNMLIKKGLVNAVRDFIDKLSGTSLKIDLEITGLNERLDSSTESIVFRILQELVNNVIKHAQSNHITIQLLKFEKELTLMIEDNGKGFDFEKIINSEKGIGLKNIISRVEFLKGQVHFDSTINKGTTVSIEIPLA